MNDQCDLNAGKILIVDDVPNNREIIERALEEKGYSIVQAPNGEIALKIAPRTRPDLILLDIMMPPGIDGFETCRRLKADKATREIPVVFITAKGGDKDLMKGFEVGGVDYITKPFKDEEVRARVRTHIQLRRVRKALGEQNLKLKTKIRERTKELKDSRLEIIQRLARATEYSDKITGLHIMRMSNYCVLLGRAYGMNDDEAELLLHASPMHDVGKIGIPDEVLLKPGKLNQDEFKRMQKHVDIGIELLSGSSLELLKVAKSIAETHHERWDGTGYPNGLKDKDIPLVGRISSLCDVFDSLTSERPYKEAWSTEDAMSTIERLSGKYFDPDLVKLFKQILPEILAIKEQFSD